jgi:hypothetical protein
MKHTQLISTGMVNTPGLLAWAQNMYRSPKKAEKAQAVKIFAEGYGLGPKTAEALVAGLLKTTIDAEKGTVSFLVEDIKF